MAAESMCNVCKEPSKLKCGSCREVSYCSKNHQKLDWGNHKPRCPSFKVMINEKFGRHLVATRTIPQGEIVIKEPPIVAGPAQVTPPVCLGCHFLLSQFTARECSVCGWPVCSEICEKSAAHRPECEITSRHKNGKMKINTFEQNLPHPSYQCLTVLRCLYLKKAQPELWKKLMELESHCQERMLTVKYNVDQKFIAEFIPKFFNFLDFSSEEILKVAGIIQFFPFSNPEFFSAMVPPLEYLSLLINPTLSPLIHHVRLFLNSLKSKQVNAHEIPLREPEYIAIYEKGSLLEHNCRANCMKSFTNSGELVIRAAEKISSGDHLSICYTDPLWGREMRMSHLLETKFFQCQCQRCLDPTEFGTHFNSFKCTNRQCQGWVLPHSSASGDDEKVKDVPKCQKCKKKMSKDFLANVLEEISQVDKKDPKSCKSFLEKYDSVLHPHHHVLVGVKLSLIDLFGWPSSLLSLAEPDLRWTINTCRELYELTTTLIPAENRLRGLLLYNLQFAMRESDRRKATKGESDSHKMRENLLERRRVLSEAYKLLSYEPDELPEGKMAIDANKTLEDLDQILRNQNNIL